jgi:hypothetical protein
MASRIDKTMKFSHRTSQGIAVIGFCLVIGAPGFGASDTAVGTDTETQFHLWAMSDPHVFSDLFLRMKELKRLNPQGDPTNMIGDSASCGCSGDQPSDSMEFFSEQGTLHR